MSELVDCPLCNRNVYLNVDGRIRGHRVEPNRTSHLCLAGGQMPSDFDNYIPEWLRHNVLYNRQELSDDSDDQDAFAPLDPMDIVADKGDATVISSEFRTIFKGEKRRHKVFIDLDTRHWYVPSSTPGHGHLYIDKNLTLEELIELTDVLVKFNIVSPGWRSQLDNREANTFRLPWIKKEKKPDES